MNEFKHGKNISITIEMKKFILSIIFYLLDYIFAVWECHLSILLLKLRRDVVVQISSGRSFQREAPAITETTLQVVSPRFRQVQFLTCVTKMKGQSSLSEHVTKIIWGELINAFVH